MDPPLASWVASRCMLRNRNKVLALPRQNTIMKAVRHRNASRARQNKPRLGRPPQAEYERILENDGWVIAQELRLHPLRRPIDPQFAPYHDRILKGEIKAIYDYCER